jgi:hypothetical protein
VIMIASVQIDTLQNMALFPLLIGRIQVGPEP